MLSSANASAIPIIVVFGSQSFANRCRWVVGTRAVVLARDARMARSSVVTWRPRGLVVTSVDYDRLPEEWDRLASWMGAALVRVPDEEVDDARLTELLGEALGASGMRPKV